MWGSKAPAKTAPLKRSYPNKAERKANSQWWAKKANEFSGKARTEERKLNERKRSLKSGKSQDPAADRYMIRQHESRLKIHRANARDAQQNSGAGKPRKGWF